ncbi:MAG: hypothetical protein Athens071424_118 [Parcubacteria group bacterium Athens0714_24]|nr:MAG: hypothetical protein Athens071424_118 [Parcubacteria group bacterium Athens0714_24]
MNIFSEALKKASKVLTFSGTVEGETPKPAPVSKTNGKPVTLPDLTSINVEKLTSEEAAARQAVAHDRKEWVKGAAKTEIAIMERIAFLEGLFAEGVPTPEDIEELASLNETLQQITTAGDEQVQRHLEFAGFIEAIRSTPPTGENLEYFLEQVVVRNHYRLASKEEAQSIYNRKPRTPLPQGAVFFHGRVYLPAWTDDQKYPSQKAVESTLVRFARATIKAEQTEKVAAIARLKEQGDPDLPKLSQGQPGVYRLVFPARTDERTGKKWSEGVGLVEVYFRKVNDRQVRFVRAKEGAGSLEWFNAHAGKFIPHAWIRQGISDNATDEVAEFADKLIRTISGAVRTWYALRAAEARKADAATATTSEVSSAKPVTSDVAVGK